MLNPQESLSLCSKNVFHETPFSMGRKRAKCNKTTPQPITHPHFPGYTAPGSSSGAKVEKAGRGPSLHSGHSSGAPLGLLPSSLSVSHSVGCSHHPIPMPERIPLCEDESSDSAKVCGGRDHPRGLRVLAAELRTLDFPLCTWQSLKIFAQELPSCRA